MFNAKDLAEESTKIMIQSNAYSVDAQTRFDVNERATALTITAMGTQTYDVTGKPWDADNDR